MATNPLRMDLTAGEPIGDAAGMAGRPFRSILKPHIELIRQLRRADKSWQEIADLLARDHKITITGRGVNRFFAAIRKRNSWPLGMEPDDRPGTVPGGPQAGPARRPGGGILGGVRGTPTAPEAPADEAGSRSRLLPHLEFIAAQRQAGESWRQIAEALTGRGIRVSHQAVSDFYKRTRQRAARRLDETAPRNPSPEPTPDLPRRASGPARPGADDPLRLLE